MASQGGEGGPDLLRADMETMQVGWLDVASQRLGKVRAANGIGRGTKIHQFKY